MVMDKSFNVKTHFMNSKKQLITQSFQLGVQKQWMEACLY